MGNYQIKLGLMIKEYRNKAQLSQAELAKKLGYTTPQFVSNFERGVGKVPLVVVGRLIKILELPEREIMQLLIDEYTLEVKKDIAQGKKPRGS